MWPPVGCHNSAITKLTVGTTKVARKFPYAFPSARWSATADATGVSGRPRRVSSSKAVEQLHIQQVTQSHLSQISDSEDGVGFSVCKMGLGLIENPALVGSLNL
jgi:hypothetical protein